MAGTSSDFPSDVFRTQIRAAMVMGQPVDESLRVTFYWDTAHTFSKADSAGVPYDLTAAATTSTPTDPKQVPAAVVFAGQQEEDTAFGRIDTSKATLTLLDEDYEQVKTADYITIGGDPYDIVASMPQGLFDVTVWTVSAVARGRA